MIYQNIYFSNKVQRNRLLNDFLTVLVNPAVTLDYLDSWERSHQLFNRTKYVEIKIVIIVYYNVMFKNCGV